MINVAVIQGRLTTDPELKTTTNGIAVTSFSVAVDRAYQKQGEEKQTDFINVVAWRKTAEFICKYFRKGSMIAIQGSIQTRNYEDKNGNKRTATDIVADNVSFCEKAQQPDQQPIQQISQPVQQNYQTVQQPVQQTLQQSVYIPVEDDELPF